MLRNIFVLSLLCFFSISYNQKELQFVEGEILFQLKPDQSIENLTNKLWKASYFNNGFRTRLISKNVNIYLLQFEPSNIDHSELITFLQSYEEISVAQLNHIVESRATIPNDPEFANQWHHENTGQTGGTVGADISTPEAWDISTGGVTIHGDTIVVCVIEEQGANYTLGDLSPNAWKNNNEIPNNGIDDDNNGFIDDYEGWNIQSSDDNISPGNHGTQVSSMIGAKGDNGVGGVGINWDVKLMIVQGVTPSNEASVLAAYDYPLQMRKLYNQTNGSQGAFVVVTNASWGVDNADPASFPLWCSFYDSLGVHGILNIGATSNSNVDVDVVGDMPTACGSNYLVSVTATNHNDARTFSGYGATTIDLAGPGQNTLLLGTGGTWGNATGTSFATPAVAGTVALMYSIDCPSFMALAKSDPGAASLMVRQALLDGVDNVPSLVGETVTGGRLNVFNALNELIDQCDTNECSYAYNISMSSVTDTSARIDWEGISNSHWFYFKESTASIYDSILIDTTFAQIDTLVFCNSYDFYLITDCDTALSNPSIVYNLNTDGCCESPTIQIDTVTATEAYFYWNPIFSANDYDVRYRIINSPSWTEIIGVSDTFFIATFLDSCENYEIQIKTNCSQITTSYSNSLEYNTKGCGACYDKQYCTVLPGNSSLEWIDRVVLNTLDYTSGNNGGYLFADTVSTAINRGVQYVIAITPGYAGFNFNEIFAAWIDFDQSGTFSVSEKIIGATNNGLINDVFTVPSNSILGQTRMRVSMSASTGADDPCTSSILLGEFEDYCIWISDDAGIENLSNNKMYSLFPNPANNFIYLNFKEIDKSNQIEIYDISGKLILLQNLLNQNNTISLTPLKPGIYHARISNKKGHIAYEKIVKTL